MVLHSALQGREVCEGTLRPGIRLPLAFVTMYLKADLCFWDPGPRSQDVSGYILAADNGWGSLIAEVLPNVLKRTLRKQPALDLEKYHFNVCTASAITQVVSAASPHWSCIRILPFNVWTVQNTCETFSSIHTEDSASESPFSSSGDAQVLPVSCLLPLGGLHLALPLHNVGKSSTNVSYRDDLSSFHCFPGNPLKPFPKSF